MKTSNAVITPMTIPPSSTTIEKLTKPRRPPIHLPTKLKLNDRLRAQLIEAMKNEEFTESDVELFQNLNISDSEKEGEDEDKNDHERSNISLPNTFNSPECWEDKVQRIRKTSPFGHLPQWSILHLPSLVLFSLFLFLSPSF
jgi:hypothetical protein